MNLKSNTLHFFFYLGAIKKEIVKPARGLSKQKATTSLNQLTEVSIDFQLLGNSRFVGMLAKAVVKGMMCK